MATYTLTDTDLCPCGETRTMSHIVKSCPLAKLNGSLSRLHSADEDAVSWLTNYGLWHTYEKKKIGFFVFLSAVPPFFLLLDPTGRLAGLGGMVVSACEEFEENGATIVLVNVSESSCTGSARLSWIKSHWTVVGFCKCELVVCFVVEHRQPRYQHRWFGYPSLAV